MLKCTTSSLGIWLKNSFQWKLLPMQVCNFPPSFPLNNYFSKFSPSNCFMNRILWSLLERERNLVIRESNLFGLRHRGSDGCHFTRFILLFHLPVLLPFCVPLPPSHDNIIFSLPHPISTLPCKIQWKSKCKSLYF